MALMTSEWLDQIRAPEFTRRHHQSTYPPSRATSSGGFSGDSHEHDGYAKNTQSIGSIPDLGGDLDDEVQVDFAPDLEPDSGVKVGLRAHGDGHGEGQQFWNRQLKPWCQMHKRWSRF